jgi:hypothetical protein
LVAKGTVVNISLGTILQLIGHSYQQYHFKSFCFGDQILAYEGTTAPTTNADATWLFVFPSRTGFGLITPILQIFQLPLSGKHRLTGSLTEFDNGYFANGTLLKPQLQSLEPKPNYWFCSVITQNTH